jgi:predicted GH43/DUF377 family glycosyl hydrolase
MTLKWEKLGRILAPQETLDWLCTSASAAFALPSSQNKDVYRLYINGRDSQKRSLIGIATFDMSRLKILKIVQQPVMRLGEKGAFDQNGTSYPYIVRFKDMYYMYYVGWVQAVQVPWINGLGLATSMDGLTFKRYSRAPILHRDNDDFIGIGSCCVLRDQGKLKMWYSRFEKWGQSQHDHIHYYNIKYAESEDGIHWAKNKKICINFEDSSEYAIAKPCVLKCKHKYLMWYSYRGSSYRIGFAMSEDGIGWTRKDEIVGIDVSPQGWDSEMICYAYVFRHGGYLYMLYNGNGYGASGLGLARMNECDLEAHL